MHCSSLLAQVLRFVLWPAISECRVCYIVEPHPIRKGDLMTKSFALTSAFLILSSSPTYGAGGKERGDKGNGSTGESGKGTVEQRRGG